MKKPRRRPTTTTPTLPPSDATKALGQAFNTNLSVLMTGLRPALEAVVAEHEAGKLPTPKQAITACKKAVRALDSEGAHAGSIMANAMGKLRKAYKRSMGQARTCIDRGDTKGAQKHLDEAKELERTIGIVDAREPLEELHATIKNVRIKIEGVAGTFPLSGAIAGTRGYKYVGGKFMRV